MSISRSKGKDHKPLTNTGGKASNDLPPLCNLSVAAAPSRDITAEMQVFANEFVSKMTEVYSRQPRLEKERAA